MTAEISVFALIGHLGWSLTIEQSIPMIALVWNCSSMVSQMQTEATGSKPHMGRAHAKKTEGQTISEGVSATTFERRYASIEYASERSS